MVPVPGVAVLSVRLLSPVLSATVVVASTVAACTVVRTSAAMIRAVVSSGGRRAGGLGKVARRAPVPAVVASTVVTVMLDVTGVLVRAHRDLQLGIPLRGTRKEPFLPAWCSPQCPLMVAFIETSSPCPGSGDAGPDVGQ